MSARESFSWVWLVTMIVTYVPYFAIAPGLDAQPGIALLIPFELLGATALVQVVVITAASIAIRLREGPPAKLDERDRVIAHRASSVSYYVLMAGIIMVGCIMPFSDHGWKVANTAVFAIVIAEIVHHGLVVLGYRRGVRV